MTTSSVLIDNLERCRIDMGPDFSCFTYGGALTALAGAVVVCLVLFFLMHYVSAQQKKII